MNVAEAIFYSICVVTAAIALCKFITDDWPWDTRE